KSFPTRRSSDLTGNFRGCNKTSEQNSSSRSLGEALLKIFQSCACNFMTDGHFFVMNVTDTMAISLLFKVHFKTTGVRTIKNESSPRTDGLRPHLSPSLRLCN